MRCRAIQDDASHRVHSQFISDIESYISRQVVEACVALGTYE